MKEGDPPGEATAVRLPCKKGRFKEKRVVRR